MVTNMYIHADTHPVQRYGKEGSPSAELPGPENFESTYAGDEILGFLPCERQISAAEYTCWHALVRQQLNVSKYSNEGSSARCLDFQLARSCFEKIEMVHRSLDGNASKDLTDG
jgi:hypothetical protein